MMAMLRSANLAALALLIFVLPLVGACTPSATPSPTTAPSKPTISEAPAAKPTGAAEKATTPAKAASPSVVASPASKPAASTGSQASWDDLVAAAKKEAKVVVAGYAGDAYRDAMLAFQKAYPDIQVEYSGVTGSQFAPKIIAERDGGQFLWDVHMGGATTGITLLKPKGVLDPVKPALVLPEVTDDSKWLGGLDEAWIDKERQFTFGFDAGFMPTVMVNRSTVPESELSSVDQLLDPKWKGKIVSGDPRTTGVPNGMLAIFYIVKGEDWLRKFLAQDLVIISDERAVVESVIRGRYPVMLQVAPPTWGMFATPEFADLVKNIKGLDIDGPAGATLDSGTGNIMLVNKAPHPDAAKVFLNWVLSQEGQKSYVDHLNLSSRRLDVESKGQYRPKPNIKYVHSTKEEITPQKTKSTEIAKEILK